MQAYDGETLKSSRYLYFCYAAFNSIGSEATYIVVMSD